MIVYTEKDVFECASAVQHADGVHLLEDNGDIFLVIAQPERIQRVEGGEIVVEYTPSPTQADRIEAQVTYTAMMTDTLLTGV